MSFTTFIKDIKSVSDSQYVQKDISGVGSLQSDIGQKESLVKHK